jgi:hypothetical protein
MLENLIPLDEVANRLPTRPGLSTVHRWSADGLQGGRVKLRTMKVGGKRLTTEEWLQEFIGALNGDPCLRADGVNAVAAQAIPTRGAAGSPGDGAAS